VFCSSGTELDPYKQCPTEVLNLNWLCLFIIPQPILITSGI